MNHQPDAKRGEDTPVITLYHTEYGVHTGQTSSSRKSPGSQIPDRTWIITLKDHHPMQHEVGSRTCQYRSTRSFAIMKTLSLALLPPVRSMKSLLKISDEFSESRVGNWSTTRIRHVTDYRSYFFFFYLFTLLNP